VIPAIVIALMAIINIKKRTLIRSLMALSPETADSVGISFVVAGATVLPL
jgi:hypothetical protein